MWVLGAVQMSHDHRWGGGSICSLHPEFVQLADVATIYKGKGEKSDLKNDRGIFLVTVFRSILMRLIYLDSYDLLDQSMSDSQVGGRKGRSVRNHIWVLNGVICDDLSNKKNTPVDLEIFDYRQCFDSLWLEECMNDMYSGGIKDDKFALLYNVNTHVNVAVKTPVGKTERGVIKNAIIQGDVFGPILCGKQIDEIGKECLEYGKYTYKYKGEVDIPPLIMLDDLVCISECGLKTAMANTYIRFKTSSKKLQFGAEKCKKMHIGKSCDEYKCQPLYVDGWDEREVEVSETKELKMEDVCTGDEEMEMKDHEKYLGDIISKDGRNLKNVQARVNKGTGIVKNILNMLEGIPFGKFYFEVAIILRNSLLVSSVLFNSEAWYNLTKAELDLLETVDNNLLRGILKAPQSTPKEMFFLELGIIPLREIIRKRRLGFLYYILQQKEDSIISKVFKSQMNNPTPKDWVSTIISDLKQLNLNIQFEDIKQMKKFDFMNTVKRKIRYKTLKDLEKCKEKHTKVNHLNYFVLKMQNYLTANACKMKQEDSQLIFKLRSRMTEVKMNMKGLYYNEYDCRACGEGNETQEHILQCKVLLSMNKEYDQMNIIDYEKISSGKVQEQLKVSELFKQNMKILNKLKKEK